MPILVRPRRRYGGFLIVKGPSMDWVTFQTEGGGMLKIQARHVVAIYDELGTVKLSTAAGGVHTLAAGTSVSQASAVVGDSEEQ
jgi:hypothetical protein